MNTLKAMALFVDIVDTGSLSAAADRRTMSATMVGNYLRALEDHLALKLLNRTTRQQSLTEFGKLYYARCVDVLELVADAESMALESKAEPTGCLRITAPNAFGIDRLMPALADYSTQFPKVDLDVVITDRRIDLVEDGFEAVFRIGDLEDSELIARPLKPLHLVCSAAPDYIAAHGEPATPADLAEHNCLVYTRASLSLANLPPAAWAFKQAETITDVSIDGCIQTNNVFALRRAALAGAGIVMLPEEIVTDDIASCALVPLLSDYIPSGRPLNLIYLRDRRISPKLRSFIDFSLDRFGDGQA